MTAAVAGAIFVELAAPCFIEDRDPGDEHDIGPVGKLRACPGCGAPAEPEPTPEERARIFADPDYNWQEPDGAYLRFGFGLCGGGFGVYAGCDRCGAFYKDQIPEAR